jgi:hypothetical protein
MKTAVQLSEELVREFDRVLKDENDLATAIEHSDYARILNLSLNLSHRLVRVRNTVRLFKKAVAP